MKKNIKTPTRRIGKRRHGFLSRMRTASGRAVITRRRLKGRKALSK
ncbi:MAG: 50S ribosomal protein L34 [Candidatus Omnitrophota bacterium]|jgi:large subunit ribosomal protein L34|nr:MAG: 50S ribosomal protein L34 [Candidatus Omnitrophota bacterium]